MDTETLLKAFAPYPYADGVIDLDKYKSWCKHGRDFSLNTYDSGTYAIEEINHEGYIVLTKEKATSKKVLMRKGILDKLTVGDEIKCDLKKKLFFVYWELERVKSYTKHKS